MAARSPVCCGVVLNTQTAVTDVNVVSSVAQASLRRSGIELQLLSIIAPTAALQKRPGQEMRPPPCGLLGGEAPLCSLQSG